MRHCGASDLIAPSHACRRPIASERMPVGNVASCCSNLFGGRGKSRSIHRPFAVRRKLAARDLLAHAAYTLIVVADGIEQHAAAAVGNSDDPGRLAYAVD